jgi:uncharacterized membrane protein YgcG
MVAHTKQEARKSIEKLDLTQYANAAVLHGTLVPKDVKAAMEQYRHHLLLLWLNHTLSNSKLIVPSVRADAIWHEHLEDKSGYAQFCSELVGHEIKHFAGLEKGSPEHQKAVAHTRQVSNQYASGNDGGFVPNYLAMCGGFTAVPGNSHHGIHGGTAQHGPDSVSHGSHGHSDGGHGADGGGASCGGAGCGGGGCGGS